MSKEKDRYRDIYNGLSQQYGQLMMPEQVAMTTHYSVVSLRKIFRTGWVGRGRGLRMRTADLAWQIATMPEEATE